MISDRNTIKVLSYLYRILEAGERGYAVCAANIDNPGLKILLKSYAQQRAEYKAEILTEIVRLAGKARPRSSIRGILHRGRIDIFSALTIAKAERETMILKEVLVGEKAALNAYEKTLRGDLPDQIRQIVSMQYTTIREIVERVRLIKGLAGLRMIVRLFDFYEHATAAVEALEAYGSIPIRVEHINVQYSLELYRGRGTTVLETSLSGAVGGGLWGSVIGALAATSMQYTTLLTPGGWSLVALAGIVGGALIGFLIGFAIGTGISEEDHFLTAQTRGPGQSLLLLVVENSQAVNVQQFLTQGGIELKLQVEGGNIGD